MEEEIEIQMLKNQVVILKVLGMLLSETYTGSETYNGYCSENALEECSEDTKRLLEKYESRSMIDKSFL